MTDFILEYIPDFLESDFKSYVDNVFIQIHLAEMMGNLEKVKHFVSDDIYERILNRLNSNKDKGIVQMYDEINVKDSNIIDAQIIDDRIYIKVNLISRYLDYLVDSDGNFIKGNKETRKELQNHLTFERKIGNIDDKRIVKCRNCGASLDINANGKCKFCHSIYDLKNDGWMLVSFEVIG